MGRIVPKRKSFHAGFPEGVTHHGFLRPVATIEPRAAALGLSPRHMELRTDIAGARPFGVIKVSSSLGFDVIVIFKVVSVTGSVRVSRDV